MAVYTKEYESQPEAILTNVIICPAVDLSANVAVPVHCQVENVLWDTGATNTLISQEVVNALGLQPKNKALISSAGGDVESWTYLVHVILPTGTAELNVKPPSTLQFPLMFSGRVLCPPVSALYSVRFAMLFCVVL